MGIVDLADRRVEPRRSDEADTFVHKPSGLRFPSTFEEFGRDSINEFGGPDDIVVYYNSQRGLTILLGVYVEPQWTRDDGEILPLPDVFRLECKFAQQSHPTARASQPWRPARTKNKEKTLGYGIAYEHEAQFAGKVQQVDLLVYLFEYDGWLIKYWFTYPVQDREKARSAVESFVSNFVWRGAA